MPDQYPAYEALTGIAQYLASHRESILERWHRAVNADAEVHSPANLSRAEFRDHMPRVLQALEDGLPEWSHSESQLERERELAARHGAERWQQGYSLHEMACEWGHMNLVLVQELDTCGEEHPEWQPIALPLARAALARFLTAGMTSSISRFNELQRSEAQSRVHILEDALGDLRHHQQLRGDLLREASHDLRGGLTVVQGAISLLEWEALPGSERTQALGVLQNGVNSVESLLADMLDLARLEAGREVPVLAVFDAAATLSTLCHNAQPLASERGLWLRTEGPEVLTTRGDENKVLRITQNLLLNALRHTVQGGVTVSWQTCDNGRWLLTVRDTGPGLAKDSAVSRALQSATRDAHDGGVQGIAMPGQNLHEIDDNDAPMRNVPAPSVRPQPAGEGIGLTIVKKLCELLDASIELDSSADGCEFRVTFPIGEI